MRTRIILVAALIVVGGVCLRGSRALRSAEVVPAVTAVPVADATPQVAPVSGEGGPKRSAVQAYPRSAPAEQANEDRDPASSDAESVPVVPEASDSVARTHVYSTLATLDREALKPPPVEELVALEAYNPRGISLTAQQEDELRQAVRHLDETIADLSFIEWTASLGAQLRALDAGDFDVVPLKDTLSHSLIDRYPGAEAIVCLPGRVVEERWIVELNEETAPGFVQVTRELDATTAHRDHVLRDMIAQM